MHGHAKNSSDDVGLIFKNAPSYYDVSLATDEQPARVPRCGSILVETAQDILKTKVKPPSEGDLVLVEVGSHDPNFPVDNPINYFIVAFRLRPELDLTTGSFRSESEHLASRKSKP